MPITRTPIVDDDGTGTTGTVVDNAWKQELYDQIDAADASGGSATVLTSSSVGAPINDWTIPGKGRVTVVLWAGASNTPITGIAGGAKGDRITLKNVTAAGGNIAMLLTHDTGSAAGNRFKNLVTSGGTIIAAGGYASFVHDGTYWQLIDHDQGQAWSLPFAAGNFSASAGGGWAVTSGQVNNCSCYMQGRKMTINVHIEGSTVTGAPGQLIIALAAFGTYTVGGQVLMPCTIRQAALATGFWQIGPMTAVSAIWIFTQTAAAFTASVTSVYGQIDLILN